MDYGPLQVVQAGPEMKSFKKKEAKRHIVVVKA